MLSFVAATFLITSCKKEDNNFPDGSHNAERGVYILNQGLANDGSEISYFDAKTSTMHNDFFIAANPTKKLGSLANDIGIYGSKMYTTVNGSNKLEITNSTTGKVIKTIALLEPRYVAFYGKHAFVSSYSDQVFAIDTATYEVKNIAVGRTPEQLAVSGDKIFVANAGWQDAVFNDGEYDNTVSVIDGNSLEVIKTIEVADNIDRVYADNKGRVYVNSETIYGVWPEVLHPSRLYVINVASLSVEKKLDFGAEFMTFYKNKAYLFTKDDPTGKTQLLEMDINDFSLIKKERFEDSQTLFAFAIDPLLGDIWVADAMNYEENGKVHRFNSKTQTKETYEVRGLPSKFIFK